MLEALRSIFRVKDKNDSIPILRSNEFVKHKLIYTITNKHVKIMKQYIKHFNKLNDKEKQIVTDNFDQLTGIHRLIKIKNENIKYSYTSFSMYHFMMLNILNKLLGKYSVLSDEMVNDKIIL